MASSIIPPSALAVAAALASLGCSNPHVFVGKVTALPTDCRPGAAAPATAPALAGAIVTARCPGSAAPVFTAVADERGRVRATLEQRLSLGCELIVTKEGHAPRTYPLTEVCAEPGPGVCGWLTLSAGLVSLREIGRAP